MIKSTLFAKMKDYGWNLEDFDKVYDYHKENINKWQSSSTDIDKQDLTDMLTFMSDFLRAIDEQDLKEQLQLLVDKGEIYSYSINGSEITISYGLSSVGETERIIDTKGKTLKQAIYDSGKSIRDDIESCLEDENDFFGYSNADELEDRIEEETDFLISLSDLV